MLAMAPTARTARDAPSPRSPGRGPRAKRGPTRILVVGASAGGLDALSRLASQLPADFPAAVFVVQHMAADATGEALLQALARSGNLPCVRARNGQRFQAGHVYLAPADHHMLVAKGDRILVTKGAMENRSRPGIDPLFRTAAVAYGRQVVGVILSGNLDDGTSGMVAIRRCGGICIVQDPEDAAYEDMPRNAIENGHADHVVPVAEMGALLTQLMSGRLGRKVPVPPDVAIEARIAERVLSDLSAVKSLGDQVPYNCPGCGGPLWQLLADKGRFRCHTGHSYTAPVLLAEQTRKIEETLWTALRMFEERRNLLMTIATGGAAVRYPSAAERAKDSLVHIRRIRAMLRSGDQPSGFGSVSDMASKRVAPHGDAAAAKTSRPGNTTGRRAKDARVRPARRGAQRRPARPARAGSAAT